MRLRSRVGRVTALLTLVLLLFEHAPRVGAVVPPPSLGPFCGSTITANTTLDGDLGPCSPIGLRIGASGITLDLNGHAILGKGRSGTVGILNGGFSNVTIANGSVSKFGSGVVLSEGADANKVNHLRVSEFGDGIEILGKNGEVSSNTVFNGGDGLRVSGQDNQVVNNVVRSNSIGIRVVGTLRSVIRGNQALSNFNGGIYAQLYATGTIVSANIANGNGSNGIDTHLDGTSSLSSNRASFNKGLGIDAAPGGTDGGGNLATDNTNSAQCSNVVCTEGPILIATPPPPN